MELVTALLALALNKGHPTHDPPGDATYAGVALRGATRECELGDESCQVCGVLSAPTRLVGVTLAPTVLTCFRTESRRSPAPDALESGTLASAQTVDGLAMPAGTILTWRGLRVHTAVFTQPASIFGRAASRYERDADGWRIESPEPQRVGDVACASSSSVAFHDGGALAACTLIGEQRVGGLLLRDQVALDEHGRVLRGTLSRAARVASVELPARSQLTLESDGRLKEVRVDETQAATVVVDGVPCRMGYVSFTLGFHPNGRLAGCFSAPTRLQGVPVKDFVAFEPSGALHSGTLAHGVRFASRDGEVEASEGVKFELDETGMLTYLVSEPGTSIRVGGGERNFLRPSWGTRPFKLRDARLLPFTP